MHTIITILLASPIAFPFAVAAWAIFEANGRGGSVGWHRQRGRFCVRYADGKLSQPFTWVVARDYAKIFGGKVVRR